MRIVLSLVMSIFLSVIGLAQDRDPHLPNPKLTPGDVLDLTKDDLCKADRKSSERNIPIATKRRVFEIYSISREETGYNVDHLIPVALGGSNSLKNLWAQPISGEWNHGRKNILERRLYKLVCRGTLDLKQAQHDIATDWISAYRTYIVETGGNRPNKH